MKQSYDLDRSLLNSELLFGLAQSRVDMIAVGWLLHPPRKTHLSFMRPHRITSQVVQD